MSKLSSSQRTSKELGTRLEEVQLARSTAEADLAIEKQWRGTLQVITMDTVGGGAGLGATGEVQVFCGSVM